MNFKKSYKQTKGYTPICKIGECSLKKLEFGIIELDAGESVDYNTEDKETAFIILEDHGDFKYDGGEFLNVGNRMSAFENRRAESVYMPRDMKLTVKALARPRILGQANHDRRHRPNWCDARTPCRSYPCYGCDEYRFRHRHRRLHNS